MLASEQDGGTLDTLKFSLASDIVELIVLTGDERFLQTLRGAVGGARRLWHVPTGDKVSDLLVAGEVGILVLDVTALNEAAGVFITEIKRQFPDLVVVVAGNRDAEIALAGLISAGTVYRFIHKPMSPGRAKLFADVAVKKYDEQRRRAGETPPISAPHSRRGLLIGGSIGLLSLIVVAAWALYGKASQEAGVPHTAALEADRSGVPARNALPEERLDEASAVIETVRKSGVVGAGTLTLLESVQPTYPKNAELQHIQGWVELDFTVAESGAVKDIAVRAASAPGVFEAAAISALSKWRYRPVMRGAKPIAQRARIRMRFTLPA